MARRRRRGSAVRMLERADGLLPSLTTGLGRTTCAAVALALVVALAPAPARSPDGLEMIAMVQGWFGTPSGVLPNYWPPLWPVVVSALGWGSEAERAAYVFNLACAGGTAYFVYGLARRAGGAFVATLITLVWVLLPSTAEQAVVLDARPLGWLLATAAAERSMAARESTEDSGFRPWVFPSLLAVLAALNRPEGFLVALGVAGAAFGRRNLRIPGIFLALFSVGVVAITTAGRSWERWTLDWLGVWPTGDILATFGFASAPTPFRVWLTAQTPIPAPDWLASVASLPAGMGLVAGGVAATIGLTGVVISVVGAGLLCMRWPVAAAALLVPFLLVAASPQAAGQLSIGANTMFFLPLWLAAGAVALARLPSVPAGLVCLVWLGEAKLGPNRVQPTQFIEGSELARQTSAWLAARTAPGENIACAFAGRSVVRDAGLVPVALPSVFEPWTPPTGQWLLLSSVDFRGNDAGGVYERVANPAWTVVEVFTNTGNGGSSGHWFAVLRYDPEG